MKDLEGPRKLWFGLENCLPFFEIVPSQKQTFLLVSDLYIGVPQRNNNIKLCKFGKKIVSVFPHNRKYHKGLSPCKGCLNIYIYIYISSFISQILDFLYHTESRIDFHSWWSDSDNRFKGIGGWIKCSNQTNFFFSRYESSHWFLNIQTSYYICG